MLSTELVEEWRKWTIQDREEFLRVFLGLTTHVGWIKGFADQAEVDKFIDTYKFVDNLLVCASALIAYSRKP
ncbi:MAG: hypothetical protein UV74_C0013G0407 [Candidatus Woesebacteria bacterium GW2011_GWB1_43_14]|uniref:Uncharacterized protein n=1 Tax=Candidatus Woesebacteria bacterium GW2011_GWB1_43_14 TaxID=1618578 RepID=A0A0G1DHE1_9BACT|nr:MAG: hypothetical protein UT21_C0001G0119 [Candidatus Woesebacteria bacterium GW2011_GWA1_39_11b]KKS78296.1 MAG: hypothetical protein UV51_C0001G0012 [Candidatus Woesebacteria bacterium GW2011_GWC1_42_9]KKS97285.1 MAG: hypothetical protein UV74_C0013G0407 [Candidatus Woesebacteria bacterium GW2011_GWB1_43_14]